MTPQGAMNEQVVVAMDGSTRVSTAALLMPAGEGWRLLARRTDTDSRGQARVLLRLIDDMLRETGRGPEDIGALVTGIGPGTFTGVRIAVATARALALSLALPVTGVSTLGAFSAEAAATLARRGEALPTVLVPVVDARRGQVFYGVYRLAGGKTGTRQRATPLYVRSASFAVCGPDELLERLVGPQPRKGDAECEPAGVLIVGETDLVPTGEAGWGRDLSLLPLEVRAEYLVAGQDHLDEPGEGIEGARLAPWLRDVLAGGLSAGREVFRPGEPGSPEAVRPIYVRSPDADVHITKMRDPWADTGRDG